MRRRGLIRWVAGAAGAGFASLVGVSNAADSVDCSNFDKWDDGTVYTEGDRAVFDGSLWEAQWWTQGNEPGSQEWGPWEEIGMCGDSSDDGDEGGESGGDEGDICAGIDAWEDETVYTGGDQAVFDGSLWKAQWWTQGNEPGSQEWGPWEEVGMCGGSSDDGSGDEDGDENEEDNLEAVIEATESRVDVGEQTTFDASESSGDIDTYEWSIEANDTDTDTGDEVTLAFDEKGSYDVELTVTDGAGNMDTVSRTLFVGIGGESPEDNRVVAYYRQWAQYDRDFTPSDISLDKVTHVQYAFARPEEDGSVTLVGDSDGQQAFWDQGDDWRNAPGGASISELAEENGDTRFALSVGGWGDSEYFSDAALTEENRQRFADDCLEWIERGNLDGVDIDWEFPHGGGCTADGSDVCDTDNVERDGDIERFTKLCETVRETLDEAAAEDPDRDEPYEVTAAFNADPDDMSEYDHDRLSEVLDFVLVMTFDYRGIWSEYTGHHAPLHENPDDPFDHSDTWNASHAMNWFEQQGWDPEQLNMAVPFYGRSWSNINEPDGSGNGEDDGLFQTFDGEGEAASGEGTFGDLGGIYEYYDLVGNSRGSASSGDIIGGDDWETYIDEKALTAYSYNPDVGGGYEGVSGEMISHDTKETMEMKMEWLRDSAYGGTMLWAVSGDTKDGELISTLWDTLNETDGDEDNEQPVEAIIDADETRVEVGESVTLDAGGSSGDIGTYEWIVGEDKNEYTGAEVTVEFEEEGSYSVELAVTNPDGTEDTDSVEITVVGELEEGTIPDQAFAPYHHMNTMPDVPPAEWGADAGTDYLHLAFVLGTGDGTPAWDGDEQYVVGETDFGSEIREFQKQGRQVVISFGGAVGNYLASDYEDPENLADAFELVVDEYNTPYIDIDDEAPNTETVNLRNEALSILQGRRPEVEVSYTVRTRVTGIADTEIVENAIENGVDIGYVNLMAMNWGWVDTDAEHTIQCAEGAHSQLQGWLPEKSDEELYSMIGITPMIGVQNSGGPFYPEDAEEVLEYAEENGVRMLSFWSVERDNAGDGLSSTHSGINQEEFEFSHIFNDFSP